MIKDAICRTCRFWLLHDRRRTGFSGPDEQGSCQRLPPAATSDPSAHRAIWPTTLPGDWCGDHDFPMQDKGARIERGLPPP
jgi:hypothetical protein